MTVDQSKYHCIDCRCWLPQSQRAIITASRCRPCHNVIRRNKWAMKQAAAKGHDPIPNNLAYQHVIKNRYTGALFKANALPDLHELVYTVPAGHLLPSKYKELPEYIAIS